MAFSGTVKLTDLNDFIAPSQACVVKTEGSKVSLTEATVGVPDSRLSDFSG